MTGEENIVNPGFYMPNRLSVAVGKALHKLLDGKVCYLVDPTFPPHPEVMDYLTKKKVHIEYFDFRKTTSRAVREQILEQMHQGNSVVFLPGQVSKLLYVYGLLGRVLYETLHIIDYQWNKCTL